jgi:putative PIN family toxin of toxin-antitoxin system
MRCGGRQARSRASCSPHLHGDRRGEPLDKERSSNLLKSLPLYSQVANAAREVCTVLIMPHISQPETPKPHRKTFDVPIVVLDTNVVLDWLVFKDVTCSALAGQLQARQLGWHATQAMRAELVSVLPRPQFFGWNPDCEYILSTFDELACAIGVEPIPSGLPSPRCRDPDDQKFIDLALALGARWLFSRDRALLELAKPARARGVEILTPADWVRRYPAPEYGIAASVTA